MVGFNEDVELGSNQDRICPNYVPAEEKSSLQPLPVLWLCVPARVDHENNKVSNTRRPLVLIMFRELFV
jgi:hypothetical protein